VAGPIPSASSASSIAWLQEVVSRTRAAPVSSARRSRRAADRPVARPCGRQCGPHRLELALVVGGEWKRMLEPAGAVVIGTMLADATPCPRPVGACAVGLESRDDPDPVRHLPGLGHGGTAVRDAVVPPGRPRARQHVWASALVTASFMAGLAIGNGSPCAGVAGSRARSASTRRSRSSSR
jgi:hypothetical protein